MTGERFDQQFVEAIRSNDGPIGNGDLRSKIPDSIGPITSREGLVRMKTGDLIILASFANGDFRRSLDQSGVTFQDFFRCPEGDIADQVLSVDPDVVIGRIAELGGLPTTISVLEEAREKAPSVINGYSEDAQILIDQIKERILEDSNHKTFKTAPLATNVQVESDDAEQQSSKNGLHWTKTKKSGLPRGTGSKANRSRRTRLNGVFSK